jgi:diguanylate cyclase (GGDEF)-like protein
MKINVSIDILSLPELFREIGQDSKSGRLTVETSSTSVYLTTTYDLWFDKGHFICLTNRSKKNNLIYLLVNNNWISKLIASRLDSIVPKGQSVGVYLKKMGMVSEEELQLIFEKQLVVVYELFEITVGRLKFKDIEDIDEEKNQKFPWLEMTGQTCSAIALSFYGMRLLKNWELFISRLPPSDSLIKELETIEKYNLKLLPFETKILELALENNTIKNIAKKLNEPLINVQKVIFRAIAAGLVTEISPINHWHNSPVNSLKRVKSSLNRSKNNKNISWWQQAREKWQAVGLIVPTISVFTIFLSAIGTWQILELSILDRFFVWRINSIKDSRITIVNIDENDISNLGHWPMSDRELALALSNLKQHQPQGIGLDLYRNLQVNPGHEELLEIYKSTPNLIGVEKVVDPKVPGSSRLKELQQIAISDVVLDTDAKVRRSLFSLETENGEIKLGLGVHLALSYLQQQNIEIEEIDANRQIYRLGKAQFSPLNSYSGAYANIDAGGYQVMLDFRGDIDRFDTIAFSDLLANRISANLIRDRIILIGATAESLKDFVRIPYDDFSKNNRLQTPGVFIHAYTASQILDGAIEGKSLLKFWSNPLEALWIVFWCTLGSALSLQFLRASLFKKNKISRWFLFGLYIGLLQLVIVGSSYGIFLLGWWIPVIAPLFACTAGTIIIAGYHSREIQQIAFIDGLTQIANRRYFDRYIQQEWEAEEKQSQYISLILCDVDYFKLYNDSYGHQAGDRCLQQVAQEISKAIRENDLVARYGGEEFVILLPKTSRENALEIAQRIIDRVSSLQIPHSQSQISETVSISCGLATVIVGVEGSASELIAMADEALYLAKKQGRARVVASSVLEEVKKN